MKREMTKRILNRYQTHIALSVLLSGTSVWGNNQVIITKPDGKIERKQWGNGDELGEGQSMKVVSGTVGGAGTSPGVWIKKGATKISKIIVSQGATIQGSQNAIDGQPWYNLITGYYGQPSIGELQNNGTIQAPNIFEDIESITKVTNNGKIEGNILEKASSNSASSVGVKNIDALINSSAGEISGKIEAKIASLENDGKITGDVTIKSNSTAAISNSGTISGNIDTSDTTSSILTNSGTISGKVDGKIKELSNNGGSIKGITITGNIVSTLINSGTIEGSIDTNATSSSTLTNSGSIRGEVSGKIKELNNAGVITKEIKINGTESKINNVGIIFGVISAPNSKLTLDNSGTIQSVSGKIGSIVNGGTILGDVKSDPNGGVVVTLTNSGSIRGEVSVSGSGNTITNNKDADIAKVTITGSGTKITNYGNIDSLSLNSTGSTEVTLKDHYKVSLGNIADYDKSGAVKVTGSGKVTLSGDKVLKVTLEEDFTLNADYDLKKFFGGSQSISVQGSIATLAQNLDLSKLPSDLFSITVAGEILRGSVHVEREITPLGIYQEITALNRLWTFVDHYLDSLPANQQKLPNESLKDQTNPPLSSSKNATPSQDLVTFFTPYYSYVSINPLNLQSNTHIAGLLGGITKRFDNGLSIGGHLNLEYQNLQGENNDLASSLASHANKESLKIAGASIGLGAHLNYDFQSFELPLASLTPYIKAQANLITTFGNHTLSIRGEDMQSRSSNATFIGGDISILSGLKIPTSFGNFNLELGFIQQILHRSKLSFQGFTKGILNREVDSIQIFPTSFLIQTRYAKDIALDSRITLSPFIKLGARATIAGKDFKNQFILQNKHYEANHSLDVITGITEIGLSTKVHQNLDIVLSYEGEFAKQAKVHSALLRVEYRF